MQLQGQINNIATINHGDGSNPTVSVGKQGEQLTAPAHGELFNLAFRGTLFHGSTAPAGTTIPISSATAATFMLYNPATSGKNLELIEYVLACTTTVTVVSPVAFGLIVPTVAAPSSITAISATIMAGKPGTSPSAILASAATIVATTNFYALTSFGAVTFAQATYPINLRGGLFLPPGYGVHTCGTAAQTAAMMQRISWAEWPI